MTRDEVNQSKGFLLVEFGASWCGHCRAVRSTVSELLGEHPNVHHIRIEDGPGLPLGRSFQVKLWPTFVFLKDGTMIDRLVRPSESQLRQGFGKMT